MNQVTDRPRNWSCTLDQLDYLLNKQKEHMLMNIIEPAPHSSLALFQSFNNDLNAIGGNGYKHSSKGWRRVKELLELKILYSTKSYFSDLETHLLYGHYQSH